MHSSIRSCTASGANLEVEPLGQSQSIAKDRLHRAVAAARRYTRLVYELGADLFGHFPADTTKVLAASAASLGCQVLALVVLFAYMRALESNELLYGYAPRTSLALFVLVAVAIAVLFFGFALLEYRSNIAIIDTCRRYQASGAQQALSLSSRLPQWFSREKSPRRVSFRHLQQILSTDVNHRSRMARLLLRSVIPAVRVMLSAGAILYINLQFSLLIFVIIGIPIAGLYWVSKKIADTITSRESGSQPVFAQQLELLSTSWENKAHLLPGAIDQELALGQAGSRHRLYFKRLRAKTFGQLLMNTANTLGLMVLVLSLGFWILQEEQGNWSLWLTYLLALRYFFTSLNRVAQAVVQSARFNRQVRRFMEFLAAATLAANSPNPENTPCPDHVLQAYKGGDTYSDDDDLDED